MYPALISYSMLTRVQTPVTPARRAHNASRTPRTSINRLELHNQLPLSPRKGARSIEDAFRLLQVSADFRAVTKKQTLARVDLPGLFASLVGRPAICPIGEYSVYNSCYMDESMELVRR